MASASDPLCELVSGLSPITLSSSPRVGDSIAAAAVAGPVVVIVVVAEGPGPTVPSLGPINGGPGNLASGISVLDLRRDFFLRFGDFFLGEVPTSPTTSSSSSSPSFRPDIFVLDLRRLDGGVLFPFFGLNFAFCPLGVTGL